MRPRKPRPLQNSQPLGLQTFLPTSVLLLDAGQLQPHRVGLGVGHLALGAQHADQPLGHHRLDRAGDQERLDAHVDQAGDRAGRVVGVQRAEHQVAREGRLDGHLGHLQVADFADQDDVGRLAQHGPQDLGERQADAVAAPGTG